MGLKKILANRIVAVIAILVFITEVVYAKDLGKVGTTFEIEEEGFTEMMMRKLGEVDMEKEKKKMEKIARERIENPKPVEGIKPATKNRSFYFDPSYVVKEDIVLPNGKVIHKAGTKVNPLDTMKFNRRLLFIDGNNEKQLDWLKSKLKSEFDRIILINGSVLKLKREFAESKQHKKYRDVIFFDQFGELTGRFGIKASPAIAAQKKKKIRIDEIYMEDK